VPVLGEKLSQLRSKAVHNSKTKGMGIILTPKTMFVPVSAFLLFLVSGMCSFRRFWPILGYFADLGTILKLFRKI